MTSVCLLLLALAATPLAVDDVARKDGSSATEKQGEDKKTGPGAADAPTYSRDIAPLLQKHCQNCHREGEIAPMSLLSYDDTHPWAASIKDAVVSGEMPPWHASPEVGKWRNDPRMTPEEIDTFVRWVDADTPEGDSKDLPEPKQFTKGWRIGQPDLVLTMPETFEVPASGTIPYKYFRVPTNFKEDRWVHAVDVRAGNPEVVHHIIVYVREPGRRGRRGNIWQKHLGGLAPGEQADEFPPGTGKLIKAGSELIFEMHYTANGRACSDRSMIGLHFADGPLRQVHTRAAMNHLFRIPPGADNHKVVSKHSFNEDVELLGLMPHMHVRGKSFLFELESPDGERRKLLEIPEWDFNWQHTYTFEKPLLIAKNSRLVCTAHFDNSEGNKDNPDPTITVRWGDQTWEEMMIGFLWYLEAEEQTASEAPAGRRSRRF